MIKKIYFGILTFTALAFFILAPFHVIYYNGNITTAFILLASGVLIFLVPRFDRIREISILGVMKAKLERKIEEAAATLEELRELAIVFSKSALYHTARSGFWGGITDEQRHQIYLDINQSLVNLGIDTAVIEHPNLEYHNCILRQFYTCLIGHQVPRPNDCREDWKELRGREIDNPPSPEELNQFFRENDFLDEKHESILEEYEYYYNNKEFKNFRIFENRDNWPDQLKAE